MCYFSAWAGKIRHGQHAIAMMSSVGRMVIVPAFYVGGQGSIPGRVDTLGSVSVNHSLTSSKCKNGTSKCGEDRNKRLPALHGMFGGDIVPIHLEVIAYTKVG